jgi:hypothetical protein
LPCRSGAETRQLFGDARGSLIQRRIGDALPTELSMLHHPIPRTRLLSEHKVAVFERNEARLIAANPFQVC